MRRRAGIERELASRADQRVLRLFGHVERMDDYRMARRMLMAEVSGGLDGWCEGFHFWQPFTQPLLLGPVFFRTTLPCSGGYHMERRGMPLHDEVGMNCRTGATTENQGSGVKYMG